jgi:putative methyltransferase (TIGR04325 family)
MNLNKIIKSLVKKWLPDPVLRFLKGQFYGWSGNYENWQNALSKCSGYNSPLILKKVRDASLKVKLKEFPYERDTVVFDHIEYSYPVLSALMWIAAMNKGVIKVLDFGGSLGSSYYQNIHLLKSLPGVKWCIVEQAAFVEVGISEFQTDNLNFYYTIDDCLMENKIDVCILSSVIQYLEKPYALLNQLKSTEIKYILVDRTPFINGSNRITIQKVHPSIYNAKYPCWFFNRNEFKDFMLKDYELILEFDALDKANIRSEFKGFLFGKT